MRHEDPATVRMIPVMGEIVRTVLARCEPSPATDRKGYETGVGHSAPRVINSSEKYCPVYRQYHCLAGPPCQPVGSESNGMITIERDGPGHHTYNPSTDPTNLKTRVKAAKTERNIK